MRLLVISLGKEARLKKLKFWAFPPVGGPGYHCNLLRHFGKLSDQQKDFRSIPNANLVLFLSLREFTWV